MSSDAQHALYYASRAPEYDMSVGYGKAVVEAGLAPLKAQLVDRLTGLDVMEIACGTGYWTHTVAQAARSIFAVDFDTTSLGLARTRLAGSEHVSFHRADAYRLDGVPSRFDGAFGMFWWSHIPHARIETFLDALHGKLRPGATVVFADQMPYTSSGSRRADGDGNLVEARTLVDGTRFEIVKNFPTADQMSRWLARRGRDVEFVVDPHSRWWLVAYQTV